MAKLVRLSLSPLSIFMPFRSSYKLGGRPNPQFFIFSRGHISTRGMRLERKCPQPSRPPARPQRSTGPALLARGHRWCFSSF